VRLIKQEIASINRGLSKYQRMVGENILWFEFNPADSERHPVYDEGPNRVWYPPVVLPVLFLSFHQDDPKHTTEGLYHVSSASITFAVNESIDRFRVSALNTGGHFKDRFAFNSPPEAAMVFTVTDFEKQGFVKGTYLTISARGEQVKQEEFANDMQGADFFFGTRLGVR
jgi:hypothetical protein